MAESTTYLGTWWLPKDSTMDVSKRPVGILTIFENGRCELELHNTNIYSGQLPYIDVLWGQDSRGVNYTLFNLECRHWSYVVKYVAQYVLQGLLIDSVTSPSFKKCYVAFPYLYEWTGSNMMSVPIDYHNKKITINYEEENVHIQGELDPGVQYKVADLIGYSTDRINLNAQILTRYQIASDKSLSIGNFIDYIQEFTQFLSLALFSKQYPSALYFLRDNDEYGFRLYVEIPSSHKPSFDALIPIIKLKEEIPSYIKNYHAKYENISILTKRLIESTKRSEFDASDFTIIAQALEGYYYRFLNKGKQKFKEIIEHFSDIKAVVDCNIDVKELKDSRDLYSHFYEEKAGDKIAKGYNLLILTQKCKVLLTCCILEQIGMTHDKINEVIPNSIIDAIVYNIRKYEKRLPQVITITNK